MKYYHIVISLTILLILFFTCTGQAKVDWEIKHSWRTDSPPLDIAISIDGKWVFVLTTGGRLLVYSTVDNTLKDTILVDSAMDRVDVTGFIPGNIANKIIVSSKDTRRVQKISFSFRQNINIVDSPFLGLADAPVTIVVFSDFECPHCSRLGVLFEQLLDQNMEYVKIIVKHFPLSFHQFARPAALAAIAADDQGKFWEFYDLLFKYSNVLKMEKILEIAETLELDISRFTEFMGSVYANEKLARDIYDGHNAGVDGIPALFVNGRRVKGHDLPSIQKFINEEIAELAEKDIVPGH